VTGHRILLMVAGRGAWAAQFAPELAPLSIARHIYLLVATTP
jgi:hypothetical protein